MKETPLCPICGTDAAVTPSTSASGAVTYTCHYGHDGAGHVPWTVQPTRRKRADDTQERVTDDLLAPFAQIMASLPHDWIEHGVIEYELRLHYPELFGRHVAASGHTAIGTGQNTASGTRFSTALQRLERDGQLGRQRLKPTGVWAEHNSDVGYWALTPLPPTSQRLTWVARCADLGRDASQWTAEDTAEIAALAEKWRDSDGNAAPQ